MIELNMMNFIPLNVFTNYALLQSAFTLEEYFKELKKRNIKAAGISDPDHLFGYPYFKKMSKGTGIKPLFGVRLTLGDTSIVLYIHNDQGYTDLLTILELKNNSELDDEAFKKLAKHLTLILPSSSLRSLDFQSKAIIDFVKRWAMLSNNFYIGLEFESDEFRAKLRSFAEKYNYDIVAFPHILYLEANDYKTYLMIDAIKNATFLDMNENPLGENYFLEEGRLLNLYTSEELENTLKISNAMSFTFDIKRPYNFPLPENYNPSIKIRELTSAKLKSLGLHNDEKYLTRLDHELRVIESLNFVNYFLIVSDYVTFARNEGILVGYGRGSAPGSLVSYLLEITFVDPLKHDLLFERFLNPSRVTMPDIDIDFMDTRRGEVIDYIKKTYGENRVAQIVTFQTNAAKASLRDTGRIFQIDNKFIDRLSKSLGNNNYSLRDAYRNVPLFKSLIDADAYNLEIIKHAVKLEGFPRQSGLHAAGIIIDGDPLYLNLPTFFNNGLRVSEYEMGFLEDQGFLKVDILGLSNLSLINDIITSVNNKYDAHIDFYDLNFDDPRIYKVISDGLTIGLFQLESEGMRKAIKEIRPENFNDVSALLALYRPGPMAYIGDYAERKHNNTEISYINDDFKRILGSTYGIIIYQEQIMQIVTAMAGFSLADADLLRRAIGKKDEKNILANKEKFLKGAKDKGFKDKEANKVFNDILKFADYGFNKSHSVVYAMITMALAYLKTYFPHEFYKEILKTTISDPKKFQLVRSELKTLGITLYPPSVQESNTEFIRKGNGLLFPLSEIIGLNYESVRTIIRLRDEKPFKNLQDFFFRAYNHKISNDELIALIESGALDIFHPNREYLKKLLKSYLPTLQIGLFTDELALMAIIVDEPKENINQKTEYEVKRLRFPLTLNPLALIKVKDVTPLSELMNLTSGTFKTLGILVSARQIKTKKGDQMAFATLSNYSDWLNLVIFPNTFKALKENLLTNEIYVVTGHLEVKNDEKQLIVQTIERYINE
ncbi:MAG: DNA polymerase III subunit alpha [Bacilli bacterium]|nr:DNA polymerase III subunit alpha [Bacilli bacterium]